MTKLFDRAVEVVRGLSPDTQDDIARILLQLAGSEDAVPVALSTEERAAIAASQAAADRGEFATDEQVRAAWAKHGL
jgi:predicted transcriptional regulator